MQKQTVYNSAPLPFQGQKRRFIGEFRKALSRFPDAATFVDLFGGSGLLSHVAKRERPDARVIYNDFDDFHLRLENIPRTNALLAKIRNSVGGGDLQKGNESPKNSDCVFSKRFVKKKKQGSSITSRFRHHYCSRAVTCSHSMNWERKSCIILSNRPITSQTGISTGLKS